MTSNRALFPQPASYGRSADTELLAAAGVFMVAGLTRSPDEDKRMVIVVPGGKTIAEYPPKPGCLYEVEVATQANGTLQACWAFAPPCVSQSPG